LKHRLARGRRGIKSLLVKKQTDTLFMKSLEDAEQAGERSTEPIDRPRRDGEAKTRASAATNAVWAIDKALAPKGKLTSLAFFIPESGTDLPRPRNFSYFSRFQALEGGTILEEYHISQFTVME
jgi:hypothetical protein